MQQSQFVSQETNFNKCSLECQQTFFYKVKNMVNDTSYYECSDRRWIQVMSRKIKAQPGVSRH